MAATPILLKLIGSLHISLFRLTGGLVGGRLGRLEFLLLTTTGRKSQKQRTVPLLYVKDGKDFIVTASNGGQAQHPGWYFNLMQTPQAAVELDGKKFNATARQAGPEEKNRLWARLVSAYPGYEHYRQMTSREIPVMVLEPHEQGERP